MLQEARVWLNTVEKGAINIEDVDSVLLGPPVDELQGQY